MHVPNLCTGRSSWYNRAFVGKRFCVSGECVNLLKGIV